MGPRSAPIGTPPNRLFQVQYQVLMRSRRGVRFDADSQRRVSTVRSASARSARPARAVWAQQFPVVSWHKKSLAKRAAITIYPSANRGCHLARGVRGSPRKARICLRLREYYRNFWQLSRLHEGSHPQATNPKNPLSKSELPRSSICYALRADAALRPLDNPAGRR
jgi:hypothetical protein